MRQLASEKVDLPHGTLLNKRGSDSIVKLYLDYTIVVDIC